ncbi:MAG: DNA replication/repair protein RecF [Acutalibacteraceae bacterium]|jgi:DNA replication and repair protein RecF
MKVLSLELKNFRNLERVEIKPCDGMNVICGENAQGKTNLLESVWLFTGAKSFRGSVDKDFIRFGEKKAECRLTFLTEGIEKEAEIEIEERRTAFLSGKRMKTPSELAENFKAIVFSPIDLKLVSEGPNIRRRWIDTAIGLLYPVYIDILKKYVRAVTQRNRILKDIKNNLPAQDMLDIFEKEIAENGTKIIKYRKRYLEIISDFLPDLYEALSGGKEKLEIGYVKSFEGENLLEGLKLKRREDMFSGKTSIGPHRDDIDFKINGVSARTYGSQGQKRSVALSLKLAEAEVIKQKTGEFPVCLMDDVMSELDPKRQNFVLNHIKGMQVFLTCCDPENVKNLTVGKKFTVNKGAVF